MDDSIITHHKGGGVTLSGPDAMSMVRAITVKSGITMHLRTGGRMMITRGWGITKLLAAAGGYTGKKYKRSQQQEAVDDLTVWIETMRSAIPHEQS